MRAETGTEVSIPAIKSFSAASHENAGSSLLTATSKGHGSPGDSMLLGESSSPGDDSQIGVLWANVMTLLDLIEDPVKNRSRRGGLCCLNDDAVHCQAVVLDVGRLAGVERAGQLFEIYDVGKLRFGKAQDRDGPAGRLAAGAGGHHLQGDVGPFADVDEVFDLGAHRRGADGRTAQRRLLDDGPQPGRARAAQDLLAAHPQLDVPPDLRRGRITVAKLNHGLGI